MAKGGNLKKGDLSIVGEQGYELIKATQDAKVIPHGKSVGIMNNLSKSGKGKASVKIDAPVNITINGNADKSAVDHIDKAISKHNDDLVEKLREFFGFNDDGGLKV